MDYDLFVHRTPYRDEIPFMLMALVNISVRVHRSNYQMRLGERLVKVGWLMVQRQSAHHCWYVLTPAGEQMVQEALSVYFNELLSLEHLPSAAHTYLAQDTSDVWQQWSAWATQQRVWAQHLLNWLTTQTDLASELPTVIEASAFQEWLLQQQIPTYQRRYVARSALELMDERRRRHQQQSFEADRTATLAQRQAEYAAQLAAANLLPEAVYLAKYGLRQADTPTLRQIVNAVELCVPEQRQGWHYPDLPLTTEQNEQRLDLTQYTQHDAAVHLNITPEHLRWLIKQQGITPVNRGRLGRSRWASNLYRLHDIEALHPYLDRVPLVKNNPQSARQLKVWEQLTQDQQKLLLILFDIDQVNETDIKELRRTAMNLPCAVEWRWIPLNHPRLQAALRSSGMALDHAIIDALARHGLIQPETRRLTSTRPAAIGQQTSMPVPGVHLTRLGRAVVRAQIQTRFNAK